MQNTDENALAIRAIAHVMREAREHAEEQNSTTVGDTHRDIGYLALLAVDTTERLRLTVGDDAANYYCREAHPRNANEMREAKARLAKELAN